MTSPLFTFPPGLLGYLRQKVGGQAPDKFGDTLMPIMEVGELYGTPVNLQAQQGVLALGVHTFFVVPSNERWWLLGYSVSCLATAVSTAAVILTLDSGANSVAFFLTPTLRTTRAAGENEVLVSQFPRGRPWVLEPGARLNIAFGNGSTFPSAWVCDAGARILRLPI